MGRQLLLVLAQATMWCPLLPPRGDASNRGRRRRGVGRRRPRLGALRLRRVVEHSVYVHPAARGRAVGSALLRSLIASTEAAGIWTIQSGVFPENTASLALQERHGFRRVGTRERPGRHHDH
jgi:L-amino acid N-acyltransferase YncA